MASVAIPLIYNQLRFDHFEYVYDPLATAPTGTLHMWFEAWTTTGDRSFYASATVAPDADPASAIADARANFIANIESLGYAAGVEPSGYSA